MYICIIYNDHKKFDLHGVGNDGCDLCGEIGGTRGSAGESRGEMIRGPDDNHDQHNERHGHQIIT